MLAKIGTIALAVALTACASGGAVPRPFPVPGAARPAGNVPGTGGSGSALADSALALRGTPYRDGGADPSGFDCSGFTQYVFGENGIALPRAVREQFKAGKAIDARTLEPGDLLFFSTTAHGPSHVGIAIGGDQFVHAPSSNGVVRVERFTSPYWSRRFVGARRVEPSAAAPHE